MSKHVRELSETELQQIAGGGVIGTGSPETPDWGLGGNPYVGLDPGGSPDGGVAGGSPKIVIGGGGRDWWVPNPGKP